MIENLQNFQTVLKKFPILDFLWLAAIFLTFTMIWITWTLRTAWSRASSWTVLTTLWNSSKLSTRSAVVSLPLLFFSFSHYQAIWCWGQNLGVGLAKYFVVSMFVVNMLKNNLSIFSINLFCFHFLCHVNKKRRCKIPTSFLIYRSKTLGPF